MRDQPWYKMRYDLWDSGTMLLTLEEQGAYLRVINQMYRDGGTLVDDDRVLARIWDCHINKARRLRKRLIDLGKVESVVTKNPGIRHLVNARVMDEIEDREQRSNHMREIGAKGGKRSAQSRGGGGQVVGANFQKVGTFREFGQQKVDEKSEGISDNPLSYNGASEADAQAPRSSYKIRKNNNPPYPPSTTNPGVRRDEPDLNFVKEAVWKAAQGNIDDTSTAAIVLAPIFDLINAGLDLELDILPAVETKIATLRRPLTTWARASIPWFHDAAENNYRRRVGGSQNPATNSIPESKKPEIWDKHLSVYFKHKHWPIAWGPAPDQESCEIPREYIEAYAKEHGYRK